MTSNLKYIAGVDPCIDNPPVFISQVITIDPKCGPEHTEWWSQEEIDRAWARARKAVENDEQPFDVTIEMMHNPAFDRPLNQSEANTNLSSYSMVLLNIDDTK